MTFSRLCKIGNYSSKGFHLQTRLEKLLKYQNWIFQRKLHKTLKKTCRMDGTLCRLGMAVKKRNISQRIGNTFQNERLKITKPSFLLKSATLLYTMIICVLHNTNPYQIKNHSKEHTPNIQWRNISYTLKYLSASTFTTIYRLKLVQSVFAITGTNKLQLTNRKIIVCQPLFLFQTR